MIKTKIKAKWLFALCVGLLAVLLLTLGLLDQSRVRLGAQLQGTWVKTVQAQEGVWLELQISGQRVIYRFASEQYPDYNAEISAYTFRALSKDTLKVTFPDGHSTTVAVTLQEDTMTLTPSVTTTSEPMEIWQKIQ